MNVAAWLFTRKEEESEGPLSKYCWTHAKIILHGTSSDQIAFPDLALPGVPSAAACQMHSLPSRQRISSLPSARNTRPASQTRGEPLDPEAQLETFRVSPYHNPLIRLCLRETRGGSPGLQPAVALPAGHHSVYSCGSSCDSHAQHEQGRRWQDLVQESQANDSSHHCSGVCRSNGERDALFGQQRGRRTKHAASPF